MTQEFRGKDSHISIAMPEGTTCRAYVPFQVYSSDDGGEIVRLDFDVFVRLASLALICQSRQKKMNES